MLSNIIIAGSLIGLGLGLQSVLLYNKLFIKSRYLYIINRLYIGESILFVGIYYLVSNRKKQWL